MTFGITAGQALIGGAILGSSLLGADAASSAAGQQSDAANRSADLQNAQYQQTRADQQPFLQGGYNALARQQQLLGLGADQGTGGYGQYSRDFGMADYQADPGYQFRLSEGLKGLQANAAARGGFGGNTMRSMQDYAQNSASQEYGAAYNRYQTNRANQLNPLQSIAGQGQTTANTLGTMGAAAAGNIGQAYQGAAQARASGYIGGANAFSGGLGNYLNYNQDANRLAAFNRRTDLLSGAGDGGLQQLGEGFY